MVERLVNVDIELRVFGARFFCRILSFILRGPLLEKAEAFRVVRR